MVDRPGDRLGTSIQFNSIQFVIIVVEMGAMVTVRILCGDRAAFVLVVVVVVAVAVATFVVVVVFVVRRSSFVDVVVVVEIEPCRPVFKCRGQVLEPAGVGDGAPIPYKV